MSKKSRIKELEQTVADMSAHIGKLNNIVFHLREDLKSLAMRPDNGPTLYGPSNIFNEHPTIPDHQPFVLELARFTGVETGT